VLIALVSLPCFPDQKRTERLEKLVFGTRPMDIAWLDRSANSPARHREAVFA
jgi:hypothetical protein